MKPIPCSQLIGHKAIDLANKPRPIVIMPPESEPLRRIHLQLLDLLALAEHFAQQDQADKAEQILSAALAEFRKTSPYFDIAQAAAYLHTTDQGIYSLVKRSLLHPLPGSGKLLFAVESLERYLRTKRRNR